MKCATGNGADRNAAVDGDGLPLPCEMIPDILYERGTNFPEITDKVLRDLASYWLFLLWHCTSRTPQILTTP
jgi:hypothetical protein